MGISRQLTKQVKIAHRQGVDESEDRMRQMEAGDEGLRGPEAPVLSQRRGRKRSKTESVQDLSSP